MPKHPVKIEICVEGVDGLVAAQEAGADRVELCASLLEGGLTPSLGVVREALRVATIPFHVIIRPRGGDFLYSELEFGAMVEDVKAMRELGVAGVVIGCLTADGRIDADRTKALVEAARPMKVTCHRAFDMTVDYREALETLIACGVDRVLTSGQRDTAIEGIDILRDTAQLEGFLSNTLKPLAGFSRTQTLIALSSTKETHILATTGPHRSAGADA